LPGATPAETRYQEPDRQYQDTETAGETSVAPRGPDNPAPAAETTAAPDDSWNSTWTWSCGDVMPPDIVLPEEYVQQIGNWNWTWNCGGNTSTNGNSETQLPPQYQSLTSQYQPINVNVSIRIASPGNDGLRLLTDRLDADRRQAGWEQSVTWKAGLRPGLPWFGSR
jgi:hypothetical protein